MTTIYFTLLCLIWGSTWMAIKVNLSSFPPFYSAGLRFLLAGILLLIINVVKGQGLPKDYKKLMPSVVFGLLNGCSYGMVYWGEQYISSGLTAILNATLPFFSLIMAAVFVNEKITSQKVIGSIVGFGGVLLLFYESIQGMAGASIAGETAIVVASAVYAFAGVYMKQRSSVEPLIAVTIQMLVSSVVLLAVAVPVEFNANFSFHWNSFMAFLYLSVVGSALAFYIYNQLILKMEVSRLSYVSMITPAIATILGVFALGENISWHILAGMALILAGTAVINTRFFGKPAEETSKAG